MYCACNHKITHPSPFFNNKVKYFLWQPFQIQNVFFTDASNLFKLLFILTLLLMKKLNILFIFVCCCLLGHSTFGQGYFPIANQGNIEFSFNLQYENADNLNCICTADGQFVILLHNSSLNDTVQIVYNNYSQLDTVVNTSGISEFDVGNVWSNSGILYSYGEAMPSLGFDYYGFYHNIDKIIAQNDTLVVSGMQPTIMASITDGCIYDQVEGNLFIDNNSNCVNDTGDDGISAYVSYSANYSNGTRTESESTSGSGYFNNSEFKSDGFIDATFTVPSIYNFAFNIPACAQIMYNITSLPATGIDFARECASDIDVMASINIGVWPGVRVATPFNLSPNVANFGCQTADGLLELILDPNVTYNAANSYNPADSISGNSLFWHYSNLTNVGSNNTGYWNQFWGGVRLIPSSSVNIGDVLTFTVNSTIPSNDVNPSNNSTTITIPVVNSYDPNTKNVEPAGVGTEGFIPDTTSTLTYTVNFQNTGNAEALKVILVDSLDAHVLPKTLKIIDASHQMSPLWLSDHVVRFDFFNIHLPDSTSDEPNSHGYVTFKIDLDQNLTPGTEIENTVYIYFDSNPAIVTNTALNTIEDEQTSSLQEQSGNLELKVYPNPMTESTTFSVQNMGAKDLTLKVYSMTGQLVKTINRKDVSEIVLHKENLESGVYLYRIQDNKTQFIANGRLVVE